MLTYGGENAMRPNLAARLGVWSAHHRKTAILGWLLFVVLATTIGGASGMVTASDDEMGVGDSGRAAAILKDAGVEEPAGELVMVSSKTADGWRDAASDLSKALTATGETKNIQAPLPSKDGKDGLLRFQMKGPSDEAADHVQPVLDAVQKAKDKGADDGLAVYQFGDASSEKHLGDLLSDDFTKAEFTAKVR